jgi:hypothetical protein
LRTNRLKEQYIVKLTNLKILQISGFRIEEDYTGFCGILFKKVGSKLVLFNL